MLAHQTDGLGPRLRIVLARHEMHLPKKGGVHQTRDSSVPGSTFSDTHSENRCWIAASFSSAASVASALRTLRHVCVCWP